MTVAPKVDAKIDVRDLKSVRDAARATGGVVLGDSTCSG